MSILENVKEVADLAKKIGEIELYRKILALENEVQDLSRAKRQLEIKVEEQDRIIQLRKHLKFKEPFYYLEDDEVPHCPACFEGPGHLSVHVVFSHRTSTSTYWDCPSCKHRYNVKDNKNYEPPTQVRPFSGRGGTGWMG